MGKGYVIYQLLVSGVRSDEIESPFVWASHGHLNDLTILSHHFTLLLYRESFSVMVFLLLITAYCCYFLPLLLTIF